MLQFLRTLGMVLFALAACASAQVIEFESKGVKYQTVTKSGVTVMYARLPSHLREYSVLQVAVSNGSAGPYVVRPEEIVFIRPDGSELHATPARTVVSMLIHKGGRNDVIRLVSAYETAIYGISNMRLTNGYEARRRAALAETAVKLKAAAAASAIALVQTKLAPGDSTDGAVFLATASKPLGPGRLVLRTNTDVFEFNPEQ
jgi:hypothetical protein